MEVFCYRVAKYIGSYVAAMNGVDAIAFTAGIGENAGTVRKMVVSYLGYLGITLDEEANKKRGRGSCDLHSRFQGESRSDPDQRRAGHCKRDGSAGIKAGNSMVCG